MKEEFKHSILCTSKGFTLAEVLITLVILGIVSSMTIPTMIVRHQKEETVIKLKKAYNVFIQAERYAEADEGDSVAWNFGQDAEPFFNQYLKRYIALNHKASNNLNSEIGYTRMNGNRDNASLTQPQSVTYMLTDGTFLTVSGTANQKYKTVFVDINGYKGPNRFGRDVFQFAIQPKYGIVPHGYGNTWAGQSFGYEYNRNTLKSGTYGCQKNGYGLFCAALIMADNWKIADDYPWF